jgi:hypothetical protein
MCQFWSNPTTKDAYRLSIASLVIEFLAAWGGVAFFMVGTVRTRLRMHAHPRTHSLLLLKRH